MKRCLYAMLVVASAVAVADPAQAQAPRTVGDVNRDGMVTAADALVILSHLVGNPVPAGAILDPDGDVHCRGTVYQYNAANQNGPFYDLTRDPIDARDAQWLLSGVVGIPLPWGEHPAGHCFNYTYEPRHLMYWDPSSRGAGYDSIVVVVGGPRWEWVYPFDPTATGQPQGVIYPWDNGVNNQRDPAGARAGLIRSGSADPTIARMTAIQEWTVALGQVEGFSAGETTVWVDWFDSRDQLRVIVRDYVPATFTAYMQQVARENSPPLFNTLVVGESTPSFSYSQTAFTNDQGNVFSRNVPTGEVTWSSSDPTVATVDAQGQITAVATGATTITGQWQGFQSAFGVTVIPAFQLLLEQVRLVFGQWYDVMHRDYPSVALSAMGDQHGSGWGNFGMNDLRREPREAFNNDAAYNYRLVAERPWERLHTALMSMREVLQHEATTPGELGDAALGWAYLMQGLALGTLGQLFDQAFVITEADAQLPTVFSSYAQVHAAAEAKLAEAIAFAQANPYTLPTNWTGGILLDSDDVVDIAHSLRARFAATTPRTVAERNAVNWAQVIADVNAGITSDWLVQSTGTCSGCFADYTKVYGGTLSTWGRPDPRLLGPADQSGAYQNWVGTPVANRVSFQIDTDDRRITNGNPQLDGTYFGFAGVNSTPWPASRGTYDNSDYVGIRYATYSTTWTGPIPIMDTSEMQLTLAEGLLRTGDLAGAVAIVNQTRTTNGMLPAATTTGVAGARCTPRTDAGACGDLWDVLKYEKRIEGYQQGAGIHFFDDRGWGDLVQGTAIQLPVPASVLQDLGLPVYTFGGVGMTGGAPVAPAIDPDLAAAYWERLRERMRQDAPPTEQDPVHR